MKNIKKIDIKIVKKIESLSHLTIDKKEINYITKQFNETLDVVDNLEKVGTEKIKITSQVTGLKNVFRKDVVDRKRVLSQKEALSNAKNKNNGFFTVKAIFNDE